MTRTYFFHTVIITVCISSLMLFGCARSRPAKFYLLHPLQEAAAEKQSAHPLSMGVGPVDLPEYLDRQQIVTRVNPGEVRLADFERWAEPLKGNFSRVLAENLSQLLATDRIAIFPWTGAPHIDYQVTVEVLRFDGAPGNPVQLSARWSVIDEKDKKTLIEKKSEITIPAEGQDFAGLVAAQSKAVAALSREIAAAIKAAALHTID
jgi:uncharacterized lipoprotein YmbA